MKGNEDVKRISTGRPKDKSSSPKPPLPNQASKALKGSQVTSEKKLGKSVPKA